MLRKIKENYQMALDYELYDQTLINKLLNIEGIKKIRQITNAIIRSKLNLKAS